MAQVTLSMDNQVFAAFAFYASVLIFKIFLVVFGTMFHRLRNQVFPSPEDYTRDPKNEKPNTIKTHPDVERTRRMHQNDLENILPFVLIGLMYILINPPASTAILVFRIFTAARLIHSIAYCVGIPLVRVVSFLVGMACNCFLAVNVIMACKYAAF